MQILVINWQDIRNPFGGGAEVHLHEIFKRIVAMEHEVILLSCEHPNFPNYEEIDGIKVYRKGSRSLFNFYVPSTYKKLRKKYNFDIVIDDINKIPFYTPLYVKEPLLAISHHFFGTSIYREANFIAGTYVYLAEKLVDIIYKNTKFAVVSDSTLNEFLSRGFDRNNFSIITNAIDHSQFPMAVVDKYDELTVTYFGRLKKYKSVDHLFKAFASVHRDFPNSKLEIIGRGDFRPELESLAQELGISNSVTFHGFVSDEEKSKLLSKTHLVVNTSMKEGWGITNIEANACGTPTLSANVPGLKDSVNDGQSGLLYEYGNINELSSKIKLIFENKELRTHLSIGAVEWAKLFSWDKSASEMLELIKLVSKS